MTDIAKNIMNALFGSPESHSLDHRMFLASSFLSFVFALFSFVSECCLGLPPLYYVFSFLMIISWGALYGIVRHSHTFKPFIIPLVIGLFVVITYDWVFMGGVLGVAPLITAVVSAGIALTLTSRTKLFAFVSLLILIGVLYANEANFQGLISAYPTKTLLKSDQLSTLIAIICVIFIFSSVLIQSYTLEQMKVQSANDDLREKNKQLQETTTEIETLRGLMPICSFCKKIRDNEGYWNQLEDYISDRSEIQFTHSLCEDCSKKYYGDYYEEEAERA